MHCKINIYTYLVRLIPNPWNVISAKPIVLTARQSSYSSKSLRIKPSDSGFKLKMNFL